MDGHISTGTAALVVCSAPSHSILALHTFKASIVTEIQSQRETRNSNINMIMVLFFLIYDKCKEFLLFPKTLKVKWFLCFLPMNALPCPPN